jgi:hypothetical protein
MGPHAEVPNALRRLRALQARDLHEL